MRFTCKHFILIVFIGILVMLLAPKTVWRVCEICGTQEYERSLFGTTIEAISEREIDEYGTHKKWMLAHGKPHRPHIWKVVKEPTIDLLKQ